MWLLRYMEDVLCPGERCLDFSNMDRLYLPYGVQNWDEEDIKTTDPVHERLLVLPRAYCMGGCRGIRVNVSWDGDDREHILTLCDTSDGTVDTLSFINASELIHGCSEPCRSLQQQ